MKTKFLLMVISCITLLSFTSCQKDEMEKGGTGGGGTLPEANTKNTSSKSPSISISNERNLTIIFEENIGIVNINITNQVDKIIYDEDVKTSSDFVEINTLDLPSGAYSVQIKRQDGEPIQNNSFVIH